MNDILGLTMEEDEIGAGEPGGDATGTDDAIPTPDPAESGADQTPAEEAPAKDAPAEEAQAPAE